MVVHSTQHNSANGNRFAPVHVNKSWGIVPWLSVEHTVMVIMEVWAVHDKISVVLNVEIKTILVPSDTTTFMGE